MPRWSRAPNLAQLHLNNAQKRFSGGCLILKAKVKVRSRSSVNNAIIILSNIARFFKYF